jgi:hypothetical protein
MTLKRALLHTSRSLITALPLIIAGLGCLPDKDSDLPPSPPEVPSAEPGDGPTHQRVMRQIEDRVRRTPTRGTALGGNATGVHACEEATYEHYEQPRPRPAQLHVVGVSSSEAGSGEPGSDDPPPRGDIDLHVTRPGNSILVLNSYQGTTWNITVDPGVELVRVILFGYYRQDAHVPEGVPVESHSYEETGEYVETAFMWPSWAATDLVDIAEEMTGRTLTSFRGCPQAASFQIDSPGPLEPPHPVSRRRQPQPIPGCESLTEESNYCMAGTLDGPLAMLGLDSGTVCRGDAVPPEGGQSGFISSLGWQGDYVFNCDYNRGIARINIADGTVDIAPIQCEAITTFKGGLIGLAGLGTSTSPLGALMEFASFDDAARRNPTHVFDLDAFASRVAVHRNQVYLAWHSTNTVETAALTDGAAIKSIPLEGYDNWIDGMDVTDDGQLVIGGPFYTGGIHLFDATTGDFEGQLPSEFSETSIAGLKCVRGDD